MVFMAGTIWLMSLLRPDMSVCVDAIDMELSYKVKSLLDLGWYPVPYMLVTESSRYSSPEYSISLLDAPGDSPGILACCMGSGDGPAMAGS